MLWWMHPEIKMLFGIKIFRVHSNILRNLKKEI